MNVKIIGALAFLLESYTGGPPDSKGLEILNISNLSSPVKIGGYENISDIDGSSEIEIIDQLAFISTNKEFVILNVSNPVLPTKIGNYSFDIDAMAVRGDMVYLHHTDTNISKIGMYIINVSNPAQPIEIYFNDSYFAIGDLFIDNDLLYLTGYYEAYEGLHVANISNPTAITQIASYSTNPRNIVVEGGFAYIGSTPTLIIVNVSDPLSPKRLGDCIVGDVIWETEIQDDYVYVASMTDGFKIIRIDEDTDFDRILDFREVYEYNTDPYNADSDQDGISDGAEVYTYNIDPNDRDSDDDGLNDGAEVLTYGTDPKINDTDTDGISDQEEVIYGADGYITDPNLADTDGDGIEDQEELLLGADNFLTNPVLNDTDQDGMADGWEVQYNLNPTSALDAILDPDGDKITNLQEFQIQSNPNNAQDNDSDQIADDWELFYLIGDPLADNDTDNLNALQEFNAGTNPLTNDTDTDTMDDFWEVQYGCNPLIDDRLVDLDNDGLVNFQEYSIGTNPSLSDTDGDGFNDGTEVAEGTNPLDKNDHPPGPNYTIYIILIVIIGVIAALLYLKSTGVIWKKAPINVFISHAVPDFESHKVKELAEHVSGKKPVNKSFYCEKDLQFNIDEWMEQTVPLCDILIFISTENSLKSKDCAKELRLARKHDIFIVPLKDTKLNWEKLGKLKLSRELGFEYDTEDHSKTFEEVSTYITKFKADLDKLYVELRKSKIASLQSLESASDLNEMQIRRLINILEKNNQIKGAWSNDNQHYISEKEVKRRVKAIHNLNLTDSIKVILKKAELHPNSKAFVEHILKIKDEKKALSQKIDSIVPYKTE
ncbi:MAG: hypothetical protein HWN66_02825 [Candidatus Helarchaeota archaeon]|nr:hypothetical protein [Candidatus Helarchaeota archaeon]